MSIGFKKAVASIIEGLANEKGRIVEQNGATKVFDIIINSNMSPIRITLSGQPNPFSQDIEIDPQYPISINGKLIQSLQDLEIFGLDSQQFDILEENIRSTEYLENIYLKIKNKSIFPAVFDTFQYTRSGIPFKIQIANVSFANLIFDLKPLDAFILTDTCGNIDGSTSNPIKNIMLGNTGSAIDYHPIPIASFNGTGKIHVLKIKDGHLLYDGEIPKNLPDKMQKYLQDGCVLVNDYAYKDIQSLKQNFEHVATFDAYTLLSKRSFIPIKSDYQIKTSFPAQITSEYRTIDWKTAQSTIESSRIVCELIKLKHISKNIWVLPSLYAAQQAYNDNTTFYIRGGLQDALNQNTVGIPSHLTPITACSLTSRNIVNTSETLFDSLVKFGFEPLLLFQSISHAVLNMQLDFIKLGWIPDAHTQNIAYLIDLNKKCLSGLLLKDAECEKINPEKLIQYGIPVRVDKLDPSLLREQKAMSDDIKIFTLYLHHTIFSKHITPLANSLVRNYDISVHTIADITHQIIKQWMESNPDPYIKSKIDFTGRYYERNLACKTLSIGSAPYYRVTDNNILVPNCNYL